MTIIEGKSAIRGFGYLQLYYKLKVQVQGGPGMRWRQPPSTTIRALINSKTRNNKKLLEEYEQWLRDNGYLSGEVQA